jgi:FKBP-type peptidyl-prolyl cis-trans isomerase FkpA
MIKFRILLIIVPFLVFSCQQEEGKKVEIEWSKDKSTKLNETLAFEEDLRIQMYLDSRQKWKMTKSGTGLQYWIYKNGIGDSARSGLLAEVKMKIEGLDGTVFHQTPDGEMESFLIDRSQVETGVQEGIKYMHIGDKAKMIVPAHLGHGLVGDFDAIPPLTTLVVDIELMGLISR